MPRFSIRTLLLLTATVAVTIPATRAYDGYRERRLAEEMWEAEVDIAIKRARNVPAFAARSELKSLSETQAVIELDLEISPNFAQRMISRLDIEIARIGNIADEDDRNKRRQ